MLEYMSPAYTILPSNGPSNAPEWILNEDLPRHVWAGEEQHKAGKEVAQGLLGRNTYDHTRDRPADQDRAQVHGQELHRPQQDEGRADQQADRSQRRRGRIARLVPREPVEFTRSRAHAQRTENDERDRQAEDHPSARAVFGDAAEIDPRDQATQREDAGHDRSLEVEAHPRVECLK